MGEAAVLLVLTAVTVRRAPARRAAVSAGLSGAAVALLLLRAVWQGPPHLVLGGCAGWALGAVAAAGTGLYLRGLDGRRRRAVEEAVRAQRLGLARDLHDFVAHDVSGMLVQAQAARAVAGPLPRPVAEALRRIEDAGQRALASLDRAVHALDERGPGIEELARLAAAFSPAVQVELAVEPGLAVRHEVSSLAYRVVTEALTNVRRHAPRATSVRVRVGREGVNDGKGEVLHVCVEDDGDGGKPPSGGAGSGSPSGGAGSGSPSGGAGSGSPSGGARGRWAGGSGLAGLAHLLEMRGGTLTAGPGARGWRLDARIPA
ncbi:histidine kinase [Actinomadura sp. ATCC 31491]|uniref:histidine kinase n=1 Tax=Actinomadura luzonensis TaxID=2805427 RepID=A0ABT0G265_9ACTN|nr:histidine kinase [Actinomadura luzonensis]MCK2218632.1 histidine kinase [Actinomadura luzonensis]